MCVYFGVECEMILIIRLISFLRYMLCCLTLVEISFGVNFSINNCQRVCVWRISFSFQIFMLTSWCWSFSDSFIFDFIIFRAASHANTLDSKRAKNGSRPAIIVAAAVKFKSTAPRKRVFNSSTSVQGQVEVADRVSKVLFFQPLSSLIKRRAVAESVQHLCILENSICCDVWWLDLSRLMCLYDEISVVTISRVMRRISSTYHRAFIAAKLNFTRAPIIYFFQKAINLILSQSFLFSYLQLSFVSSKTRKTHRWLGTFLYSKSSRSEKISPFVDYYTLAKWALSSVHQQFSTLLFVPPKKRGRGRGGRVQVSEPKRKMLIFSGEISFHSFHISQLSNTSFHHKVNEQQNEWLEFAWEDFSFLTFIFFFFFVTIRASLVTKKWNFSTLP